ncbi:MAG: DUF192 domain-containing protein [Gemmatimonadota bacterium]
MQARQPFVLVACALLTLAACEGAPEPAADPAPPAPAGELDGVTFDTASARVLTDTDTLPITVELAATEAQRAYGLMDRESLPEDHGMLFTYGAEQPGSAGFWMYRTLIPLDIAFLDGDGRIVAVLQMDPCRSADPAQCRVATYAPGVPYRSALEMARGWFAVRGVGVGDQVVAPGVSATGS